MKSKTDMAMMDMFNMMLERELSPNQFFVLYCMQQSISPNNVNLHQELRHLQNTEYLDQENKLLPKAISTIAKIESFFKIHKKKTSNQLLGEDFSKKINEYNELFPKKKAGSGKYMRTSPKNLEANFRWFFENFTYSWETILKATEMYLSKQQDENYKYTRTSMYFIRKQDSSKIASSDLADYCEIVESGETIQDKVIFKERVV
jgi:hypothetical protein